MGGVLTWYRREPPCSWSVFRLQWSLGLCVCPHLGFMSPKSLVMQVCYLWLHLSWEYFMRWFAWCFLLFAQGRGGQGSLSNHWIERLGQRIPCHPCPPSCQRKSIIIGCWLLGGAICHGVGPKEVKRVMVPPSGLSIRNLHLLMTLLVCTTLDPSSRSWSSLWYFPLQGTCSLVHGEAGVGQRPKTVRTGVGRTPWLAAWPCVGSWAVIWFICIIWQVCALVPLSPKHKPAKIWKNKDISKITLPSACSEIPRWECDLCCKWLITEGLQGEIWPWQMSEINWKGHLHWLGLFMLCCWSYHFQGSCPGTCRELLFFRSLNVHIKNLN